MLKDVGRKFGFNLNTPIEKMNEEQINVILYGTQTKINYNYVSKSSESSWEYSGRFRGVIPTWRKYSMKQSQKQREKKLQSL